MKNGNPRSTACIILLELSYTCSDRLLDLTLRKCRHFQLACNFKS